MTVTAAKVKVIAQEIHARVVSARRYLHANPELSFAEHNTAAFVKQRLSEEGINYTCAGETGVIASIKGEKALTGPVVALRADMDALPIREVNEIDYRSGAEGVMHACGHDAHTASLLGTATILQRLRAGFAGTVRLIFQPAEEKLPGGAVEMIRAGALAEPVPVAVLGQHVMPVLPMGRIGIRPGKFMASMDELFVTIRGIGGHGAQPHLNVDPVLIAAQLLTALQQLVSRMIDPIVPAVLSFGKVIADGAINVIPDSVYMEGTFRVFDETIRNEAHTKMQQLAHGLCESLGGTCDFVIRKGYPCLLNDEPLTHRITGYMKEYMGEENIVQADQWMAAEDFAWYSQLSSACFYLLGTGNPSKATMHSLHSPHFNIDEDALLHSTGLMAYLALSILNPSSSVQSA